MTSNLIYYSNNCEINVQMYKVQNMTFSSRKYPQNTLYITVCTAINVQSIEQFVHLYIIKPFFIQRKLSAEKPFVCILICGEIKNKNNSYTLYEKTQSGDIHG